MPRSNRRLIMVFLIATGLQLSACQQKSDTPAPSDRAKVEYTGMALYRVRLTARKAKELGIQTTPVREAEVAGAQRKLVPLAAVVHDQSGNTWTFTNPDSLVFIRERIRVDHVDGDMAVLSEGPPAATAVVTVGAANLFNDEFKENREGLSEKSEIGASDKEKKLLGTATMKDDGTIKLVYKAAGATGLTADIVIEYKPKDEDYQKILALVGGLKAGETKSVPPWPDK